MIDCETAQDNERHLKVENTRLKLQLEQVNKRKNKNGKRVSDGEDTENFNPVNVPKKKSKSKEKQQPSSKKPINRYSRMSSTNPLSQGKEEEVLSTLVENI